MSHIDTHLLAYLDGELSPAQAGAVEAHLAGCRACRASLAELRSLRAGLSQAVPAAYQAVQMAPAAEARMRSALAAERARQTRAGGVQRWLQGALAGLRGAASPVAKGAIPLMAVLLVALTANTARLPLQTGAQETLVLGRDQLVPGTEAALRVLVRDDETSQPIANAQVQVQLRKAGLARTVYAGSTDTTGSAPVQFQVPADWQGQAELVVEASSDLGDESLTEPIRLVRSYRLLLSSDKPVYQPGETIHLRTLALGSVDGLPAAGASVRFEVLDPQQQAILNEVNPSSEFGIAATDLVLAGDAAQGQYQLRATLAGEAATGQTATTSELSVQVSQAELPAFRVDVTADASYYLPGNLVSGQVSAGYFFGKPLPNAQVQLELLGSRIPEALDQEENRLFVRSTSGQTDAGGVFNFQFELPPLAENAFGPDGTLALALEATVTDPGGRSEFGWQTLTMARQPILIDVVAEGGSLRAGVENVLYILTSYPDGQPVAASLEVHIASDLTIEEVSTEFGLSEVFYTPRAGDRGNREVQVIATDATGRQGTASVSIPLDAPQESLLLRTDRAIYQVGDSLVLEALAAGAGQEVYLDVVKGGQTLLNRSAAVSDGRAIFAIDLTPDLAGTLELQAYQVTADGNLLRDGRVVVVDAPAGLAVELSTDRDQYRPGEQAQLTVQTQALDQGVEAAVGLAVVNEAVYAQREYQPGFARLYFILDQALQDSGVSLPGEAVTRGVIDSQVDLRQAQQLTAKASWVSYQPRDFSLNAQAVDLASREAVNRQRLEAFQRLALVLGLVLALAPLVLALVVLNGLRRNRLLGKAASRLLLSALVLGAAGALLLAGTQALAGRTALLVLAASGLLWMLGLVMLAFYGWRRRDQRAQSVVLLLLLYVTSLALIAYASGQGVIVSPAWIAVLAVAFGLLLGGLLLFGWGLHLEGERAVGLLVLVVALLIVPLVTSLAMVDIAQGDLIERITGPAVYGLPGGLLAGCAAPAAEDTAPAAQPLEQAAGQEEAAPAAAQMPQAAERTVQETVVVESEVETEIEAVQEALAAPEAAAEVTEAEGQMKAVTGSGEEIAEEPPDQVLESSARSADLLTPEIMLDSEPQVEAVVTAEASDLAAAAPAPEPTSTPTVAVEARAAGLGSPTEEPPADTPVPAPTPTPQPTDTPTLSEPPTPTDEPTLTWTPAPSPQPTATAALGIGGGIEPSEPTPELALTLTPQPTATPEPSSASAAEAPGIGGGGEPSEPTPLPPEALPIIRQRFPQTLYWNPQVVTGLDGLAQVSIPTGDAITSWRVTALAVGRRGELGSATLPLTVFQPLFLEVGVPAELVVGEEIIVPVQVFNYGHEARSITLVAQADEGLLAAVSGDSVSAPANEVIVLRLRLQARRPGTWHLTLTVLDDAGAVQDARQLAVQVLP